MEPTYTPPIPVIGNHPAGCSCSTCEGGRKRLLASPFVRRLISEMGVLHEHLYKATSTKQISAPELEKRVLELTDELANAQQGAQTLQNALDESRKINQARETQLNGAQKQLRASEQKLAHFTSRATSAEAFLDTVKAALDCKDPAKLAEKAQKLQGDLGEEKRLHNLSKMSDANARGILDQIRTELGGDPDESAHAKVVRLAEALRLAEQGRDAALEKFRVEQDAAVRHAKEVLRQGGEIAALKIQVQSWKDRHAEAKASEAHTAELLRVLSIEHDALKQEKRTAEGRYLALLRRRSVEIAIVLVAGIGGALLFAIASMIGGTR